MIGLLIMRLLSIGYFGENHAQLLQERGEKDAQQDSRKAAAAAVGLLYGSEMASALEYTFTQWLPLRDDALRFAAAEALAAMIGLLAPEQMQPLLPRLVPGLLAALKKEKEWERLPVTQALWAALSDGCQVSWLSIQQRSTVYDHL